MNWPDEIRIPSSPTRFHDSYREKLEEAIAAKIEGEEIQLAPDTPPESGKVVDLLDALQASVETTKKRWA